MTVSPTNKAIINFEDDFIRNSVKAVLLQFNHENILPYVNVDILPNQHLFVKIHAKVNNGSLRDKIYKSVSLN